MIPLSQALLLSSFSRAKAGSALAIWAMTTLVAPVTGPLLGGWITDNISWPWIFYINIPVGVFAAVVTWSIYRSRETERRKLPIDGVGLGLLIVWVGSLQVMLDKGEELDWFHSSTIIALAVTAAIVFCVFLVWELVDNAHPIVDLRLFKRRNFWTGTLAFALGYGVFFGNVVLLPLWLQQYMDYTATDAGMLTAPVGILALLLSPLVGRWVGKVDQRWLATVAFVIFAVSLYMRTSYNTQANFGFLVVPIIVQGAAMAFFFVPLVSLVLSGLTPDRIPAASGLSNFARIVSGSFGTSIATTLWDNRAILHHAQLTEYVNNSSVAARELCADPAGGRPVAAASRRRHQSQYRRAVAFAGRQRFVLDVGDSVSAHGRRHLAGTAEQVKLLRGGRRRSSLTADPARRWPAKFANIYFNYLHILSNLLSRKPRPNPPKIRADTHAERTPPIPSKFGKSALRFCDCLVYSHCRVLI